MDVSVTAALFSIIGSLVGALMAFSLQRSRVAADIAIAIEAVKTDHMAEKAALHYLNHKGYTDRSFKMLSQRLGGFEDNELRKILVRAGAVRYTREDGSEWWRLLSRVSEAGEKASAKDPGTGNEDL